MSLQGLFLGHGPKLAPPLMFEVKGGGTPPLLVLLD
jgi:hypothetical protein